MTLTVAQTVALEALEVAFGPSEVTANRVKVSHADYYRDSAAQYAKYVVDGYACYKMATDPDFAEAQKKALAEEQRVMMEKRAERADEVRDAVVIGFLSGLMAKISKKFPKAEAYFEANKEGAVLHVAERDSLTLINVAYSRDEKRVYTLVESATWNEDVTHIRGSVSPREQLEGFDAVLAYLEAGNE